MRRFRTKAQIREHLRAGHSIVTDKAGTRTVYRCSDDDALEAATSSIYKDRKYIDYSAISKEAALRNLMEANIGTIKQREQDAIARKALPKIRSFFRRQRTLFMASFADYRGMFPESLSHNSISMRLVEQDRQMTLSDFDKSWTSVEGETTDELQALIFSVETDAISQGADIARQFFDPDVGGSFDLENPRAVNWFSQHGGSIDYIKGIQGTSKSQIKTIITKSLDEGWSYNQTSKAIRAKFTDFTRARAQLIATHEAAQAYEAGNRIFVDGLADQGIKIEKMWMNSQDEKVTPECLTNTADGWVPLNQAHTSGDLNPPRFPGCRCYENYREVKR